MKQLNSGELTLPLEPKHPLISETVECFDVITLFIIHSFVNRRAIPVLWVLFTHIANVVSNDGQMDTINHMDLT